ncbi:hypothetical protein EU546_04965, partial [Candidatus Thorarchaeota archaeon]
MPRSLRGIPKELAAFGERQFKETGAIAVEVLRVKASTMRKYFRRLQGITYLVAVINLDRIRVYFFNREGLMLVGENVESAQYEKIREKSRLLVKFEKPREPTEEELRMEATEELRTSLARAIKRVARFLAVTEPPFPETYVIKEPITERRQSFGLKTDNGAFLFQESLLHGASLEGLSNRAAFLLLLIDQKPRVEYLSCVGNAISTALMKSPSKEEWEDLWFKQSKDTDFHPLMRHFLRHLETYEEQGFSHLLDVAWTAPPVEDLERWMKSLGVIHDTIELSAGTEEYPVFKRFLDDLGNLSALMKRRNTLERCHLAPRVWCNPRPLERQIEVVFESSERPDDTLCEIIYMDTDSSHTMRVVEGGDSPLTALEYMLNLEDVFPKSGGLVARGKYLIER